MRGYLTDPTASGGIRLADDLPEPQAAADELLVDVRAFAVNRGEIFLLSQRADGWQPGQDLAGVVVAGARDGSGPPEGARVVGLVDWHSWSERVAVRVSQVAVLPEQVSFEQAASLPIAGLTALRALRVDGPVLGRRVLVTGATGGVGQFAVQLAVVGGALVTAQVSAPERAADPRRLGAHNVVVELGEDDGPFDLILDGVGGSVLSDALHQLAPGGTLATYGALGGPAQISLGDFRSANGPLGKLVGFFVAYPEHTRGADLGVLVGLVADGRLTPQLGVVRDWQELPTVLDLLRERAIRGKAVLVRS